MSTVTRQRIRLACDPGKDDAPIDLVTNARPNIRRGADLQFELGLFWNSALQSVSNVASITLEVRLERTGSPVISGTVNDAELDDSLDDESWEDESKQHALVVFTNEQTAAFTVAGTSISAWLIVKALTDTGEVYDWTYGEVDVTEVGLGSTGSPEAGDPLYYTQAEVNALIQAAIDNLCNGSTSVEKLSLRNLTTDKHHFIQLEGTGPDFAISPAHD